MELPAGFLTQKDSGATTAATIKLLSARAGTAGKATTNPVSAIPSQRSALLTGMGHPSCLPSRL
jgi:hypothetical protein